jgi:hypothetical protein
MAEPLLQYAGGEDAGMRETLLQCLREGVEEINVTREEKIPTNELEGINFYGDGGVFDSMHLINFLMIVEEKVVEQVGVPITIVSEKAVSRKVSPFSNVSTLIAFLVEEIEEARGAAA